MRILQILPYYVPAWGYGGPVRIMYDIARELIQLGNAVEVYTSDSVDRSTRALKRKESIDGIIVQRFRNISNYLAWRFKTFFFMPVGYRTALSKTIHEFDIIHIGEARHYLTICAAYYARRRGIPYVLSAYGSLSSANGIRGLYRRTFDALFSHSIVKGASGLIAQTEHEVSLYREFGATADRIRLIPLGVDMNQFENLPPRGQFRTRLGISDEEKVILYLGRLHPSKGLELLIRAFLKIVEVQQDARLVIVGRDDGWLDELKQMILECNLESKVFLSGPLYDRDRLTAYVDADVFAITSPIYEETSLAALEACACGTQIIVTKQCEIPWLENAEAGVVIDYDEADLVKALTESLRNDMTVSRGKKARIMVANRFDIPIIASEHAQLFTEILHDKRTQA